MAGRTTADISKYRLDSYRVSSRPSTTFNTWQQFRSSYRSSELPMKVSPLRSPREDRAPRLSAIRTQSPLQKYRANPDLFYQTLSNKRATSPTSAGYCSGLTTGLLRTRNESSVTTAVLKRRLNDVLKVEDLLRAQEVLAEMTSEDVRKLPPSYLEELMKTLALLDRKVRHS